MRSVTSGFLNVSCVCVVDRFARLGGRLLRFARNDHCYRGISRSAAKKQSRRAMQAAASVIRIRHQSEPIIVLDKINPARYIAPGECWTCPDSLDARWRLRSADRHICALGQQRVGGAVADGFGRAGVFEFHALEPGDADPHTHRLARAHGDRAGGS